MTTERDFAVLMSPVPMKLIMIQKMVHRLQLSSDYDNISSISYRQTQILILRIFTVTD